MQLEKDFRVKIILSLNIIWISVGLAGCAFVSKPKQSDPITVAVTPASTSVFVSQSLEFFALVQNDGRNKGVSWSLSQSGTPCSPGCASIVGFTSDLAAYAAPSAV